MDREAINDAADHGMLAAYWAAQLGDAPALFSDAGDRTFAEVNADANRLVRTLHARGVQAGDGVALMAANRPEYVETYQAALRAGFRLTTVNWHLTGEEAGYIVDDCEATALVADAAVRGGPRGMRPSTHRDFARRRGGRTDRRLRGLGRGARARGRA